MNRVERPVRVGLQRQPEGSQPAIDKLNEIASHAFVGFINQRITIDVDVFEPLIARGA